VILPFFYIFKIIYRFNQRNGVILTQKIFTLATATKVRMLCYLLAQYVIVTSL